MGSDQGFRTYASGCDKADWGEWLYDLVWLRMEDGHVVDVPLIMESEWDRNGLMDDFAKLVVGQNSVSSFLRH